jgi:hypothetical protein
MYKELADLYSEEDLATLKGAMTGFIEHGDTDKPTGFARNNPIDKLAASTTRANSPLFEIYFGYVPEAGSDSLGVNTLDDLVFKQ